MTAILRKFGKYQISLAFKRIEHDPFDGILKPLNLSEK